jgi:transcriptional regulator with XRE-family HTH domain
MSNLAERARTLRWERGLTITEVAERSGLNNHTISNIEHGKANPRGPTVLALAKGLGVNIRELTRSKEDDMRAALLSLIEK